MILLAFKLGCVDAGGFVAHVLFRALITLTYKRHVELLLLLQFNILLAFMLNMCIKQPVTDQLENGSKNSILHRSLNLRFPCLPIEGARLGHCGTIPIEQLSYEFFKNKIVSKIMFYLKPTQKFSKIPIQSVIY